MRLQKQLIKHDPDNGQWGDCFRTALASILDMDAREVPHFADKGANGDNEGDIYPGLKEWLAERGLAKFTLYLNAPEGQATSEILGFVCQKNPGIPFLMLVETPQRTPHIVVAQDSKIILDPATGDSEEPDFYGPVDDDGKGYFWWFHWFVPLASTPQPNR